MRRMALLLFALFFLAGCEKENRSIRFLRWTPHGIVFIRSGGVFRWGGEADLLPSRIGEWSLKEERFALSPDGGRIAIVPDEERVWNIWEIDLLTGEGRKITDSVYKDCFPVYDPSGTVIYFISYRGGRPDIWRVRLENLSADNLTDDERKEEQLTVSPDGGTLLYTASEGGESFSLYSREIGGGEISKIADGLSGVSFLRFSPGGDRYAFCSGGGLWIGRNGEDPSRIEDADLAAWSGSGRSIYFCSEGDIWQRTFGLFARRRRLTTNVGIDTSPSSSRDGRKVAYATGAEEKPELLTVVSSSFSPGTRVWCPPDAGLINSYYLANGLPGRAARYCASVLDKSGEREKIARLLAGDYLRAGKYRQAVAVLRKNTQANYEIGKIYMYYLRDFSKAMKYFKGVEAKNDLMLIYACSPGLLRMYCRGWVDIQKKEYGRGIRTIDMFLERSERSKAIEPIYYMRAEIYDRDLRDSGKAIHAYREALEAWPAGNRAVSARVRLAQLCEEDGELHEALDVYRSLVESGEGENASEKAMAYASILRIMLDRGEDFHPLLREISVDEGPYRREFADSAIRFLDSRGEHAEANMIIRLALFDWELEPGDLGEGLSRSLSQVDADMLVQVRLDELPPWFKERITIVTSKVEPELVSPVGELLKGVPASEAGNLTKDMGGLRDVLEFNVVDYILGNLYLNEGDASGAVSHFRKLCPECYGSYYHQLKCCMDAGQKETVEWLELERKHAFAFWGDVLRLIDVLSGRRDIFSIDGGSRREPALAVEYRSFISKYPRSSLVPACAARIASAMPESEKRKALLEILDEHGGGCISIPFSLLIGDYVGSGNYGLALAVGEPLARSVDDPSIKLAVAGLLSEVGMEGEAKVFLWDISINYTDSPEWGFAQEKLISDLVLSGKYRSSFLMLDELMERRPSSEFVGSGEARLLRIELMARLGMLAEAAGEASALIAGDSPRLNKLPARMTDDLARFMFEERRETLMKLYSSVEPEEKTRLEEMVPELKNKKQDTRYKKQTNNNDQ